MASSVEQRTLSTRWTYPAALAIIAVALMLPATPSARAASTAAAAPVVEVHIGTTSAKGQV